MKQVVPGGGNYFGPQVPIWFACAGLLASVTAMTGTPALPSINTNNVFNVTTYGAATGNADNATYIQAAINAASAATAGVGGGTVEIPGPGTYLSGPLTMQSKVNLQIDTNATLMMLPESSWPSSSTPFILGTSVNDVEISGSGTIDGQGAAWWGSGTRPNFIQFTGSHRILIQDVRLQNPPKFHLMLKGKNGDITIQGINIDTDPTSPNTDGMDIGSTNMLIQNCHITDGDDNIEIGGSSDTAADIMITNCMFGHGHGVSVGSLTQAGISNVTVINCIFTNTDNAIRMKSDNDRGGIIQNMSYYNIGMTNIKYAPIIIYSYYNVHGNPTTSGVTPSVAAGTAVASVSGTTPIWRNIVISNVTATAGQPGMIWARTELPATNIILSRLNITSTDSSAGDSAFALYNVRNVQVVNSQVHPAGSYTFELFNSQVTFTNTATGASAITLDGTSVTNALAFYNQSASLSDSTVFGATPISLGGSTLSDGTSLTLAAATPVNFTLGTNLTKVSVTGSLTLNSTLNIAAGDGFGAGTYTLFTYGGSRSGTPVLGTTPAGFNCVLSTATAGQVNLLVTSTNASPTPTTTSVQSSVNPSTYGTVVTFTATVSPAPTNGESVTFKDGSTTLGIGTLSSGQALYTNTATQLAAGSHSITAVYAGDGAYGASTSSIVTQTINKLALTVTGLTVNNKVYDGTTAATLNTNGYALHTVIGGDVVTLATNGYTATFASSNVANGISVTVTNLSLGGAQAANYTLTQPVGLTANITPAGSSILLTSSANPVAHLSPVSFTANVTPSTLSGSVLFLTNGVAFNSQTLSGGAATSATTAVLPRGTNTITAQYSGNSNYSPSTNTLNQIVTNNPPVANRAVYYRLVGYPLTIVITNLATNWSDLDGDEPVLAGVNASSTNGGTVTYDSTNIYYSDSNNVTDQFGYNITDGQGGTASGVVTVLMAQQTIFGGTINSNGSVTFSFSGIPGNTYWVETTTNLMPPVIWMTISTNTAATNGLWQFTDIQATNFPQGFYRTQLAQ